MVWPADPAIKSHDVIVLKTSDEPPTAPSCCRNVRRVRGRNADESRLRMNIRVNRNGFVRSHKMSSRRYAHAPGTS